MMGALKPYREYKESGQDWIANVPSHWELRPAFGVYEENHDKNTGMRERTVLSLSYGRIVIKPPEKLHGLVPESFETYQIVNAGDIIVRTTDLQNDHNSLRIGLVKDRGIITSAYLALRVKAGIRSDFGYQVLNVWDLSKAIYGYGSGLRQNLGFFHFKRMLVAVPPPEEQDAIVKFLNYASGQIDRAIKAKRRTIALLNEQKQAIIHRTVTRGLSPNPLLKPSGNLWLGEVPVSWDVKPLCTISSIRNELNPNNLPLLSVFLNMGVILYEQGGGQVHAPSLDLSNYQVVRKGDFVLNNQQAWRGSVGVSPYEGIISPAYFVLKLADCLDPVFANYLMRSRVMVDQYVVASKGVGDIQRTVFWPFLRKSLVPIPDMAEQKKIVEFLQKETASLDGAILNITKEINLLSEYRTRLMSDVVTGKLDVREAAKNLPKQTVSEPSNDAGQTDEEEQEEAA